MKNIFIKGNINFKSQLSIEDVAKTISNSLFGGAKFCGLEKCIYDEVPAVFIENGVLGLSVIIQGYEGIDSLQGYWLEIIPNHNIEGVEILEVNIDNYLNSLFKNLFSDDSRFTLIE